MTTRSTGAVAARRSRSPWATLVAVAFGVMMVALDGTIVAVANPVIGADLGASLSQIQWIIHGYLLGLAVFLVTAGRLGDRFGYRRTYLVGVVGFVLASVAIAFSPNVAVLVAFRVTQGIFGALLVPAAMGLLRADFPAEKLGRALGAASALISTATAGGPIVGGFLVDAFGWEAVFLINLPVGVVAVASGLRLLPPNEPMDPDMRFDLPGIAMLSAAVLALVWVLVEGPGLGWSHPAVTLPSAGMLLLGAGFVLWERRPEHPLLPLTLFTHRNIALGSVLMVCMAVGLMATLFFATFYLQGVRGLGPAEAGLRLLPITAAMAVAAPIAGRVLDRFGVRAPTTVGFLLAGAGMALLSRLGTDTGTMFMVAAFALLGVGLGTVMTGATTAIVGNAPVRFAGVASALQQATMQLGGSLGTAVLSVVMSVTVATTLPARMEAVGQGTPSGDEVERALGVVTQGDAVVPEGAGPEQVDAVTRASHLAFLDGLGWAFVASAAILFAAAALSLLLRVRGSAAEDAEPGPGQVV